MVSRSHSNTAIRTEGVFVCIRYRNFSIWKMCLQHYVANICRNDAAAVFSRGTRNVMKKKIKFPENFFANIFYRSITEKKRNLQADDEKNAAVDHIGKITRACTKISKWKVCEREFGIICVRQKKVSLCLRDVELAIYICVLEPATPHPISFK